MIQTGPLRIVGCACAGTDRLVADAVAEELARLTGALSDLAFDLGGDPAMVRRHMASLQAIDLITQIHLALADMLRSGEPLDERLKAVPVEALGERLAGRLGVGGERLPSPGFGSHHDEIFS